MMKRVAAISALCVLGIVVSVASAYLRVGPAGAEMSTKATAFLSMLSAEQKAKAVMDFESPQRVDWHFIPKERKGLPIKEMNAEQKAAALALLRSSLSEIGYDKATKIMELEHILHVLETERNTNRFARETDRYFFTVFGKPAETGKWGLSVEGHHLSLNFVVEDGKVVSSTPTALGANPATVKNEVAGGQPVGTRLLAKEEQLAFDLLHSLNESQAKKAIFADKAIQEVRGAGEPQPPADERVGISFAELDASQQRLMKQLVVAYVDNLPEEVREARMQAILASGPENVRFAWAGATQPGVGHYYRVQGPTFLIEFVNTQPDAAGNIANHIHTVFRDMRGDFGIPVNN